MIAVDTSVAVAAFGEWHRLNAPARAVLDEGAALPAGLTARRAQARLVTTDHRAGVAYDLVGVAWSHLGDTPADS